ncbi:MAG: hypothetical protein N2442_09410 [Spirochaetes bacterium]|nr:hypothetical protein [Spirochaetota bacterium]
MKARILLLSILLVVTGAALLYSFDFGVVIDNSSSVSSKEGEGFIQENNAHLWLNLPLGESWVFNASVMGTFSTDTDKPLLFADVETLSLKGTFPHLENGANLFVLELGRFFHKEFSGFVFAHRMDGVRMEFGYPSSTLQIALGYTGLLNKYYTSLVMSKLDALDDLDKDILLAPRRLIGNISWSIPELFARQNLNFSILVNEDLRHLFETVIKEGKETFDPSSGGLVDTQYFGVGLDGPLSKGLFYSAFFYLGTGRMLTFVPDSQSNTGEAYLYKQILSGLGGLSVRYYLEEFFQSVASLQILYATGDSDSISYIEGNKSGTAKMFLPISGNSLGTAFQPKVSNLVAAELAYSLKPFTGVKGFILESLQAGAKLTPFFKASKGAMSEGEVDPAAGAGYLGTDLSVFANLRPFSDLGLGVSLGFFLPNKSAFLPGKDDPIVYGQFVFSFSF